MDGYGFMDGWMYEWMDGYGWMNVWIDGRMNG